MSKTPARSGAPREDLESAARLAAPTKDHTTPPTGWRQRVFGVPPTRYLVLAAVSSLGCYLDLATKRWTFSWRGMPGESPVWWIWEDYIGIETALNTGALFGLGHNQVHWFAVVSVLALVGVLCWYFWSGVGRSLSMTVLLGCIVGGILGNLYDRLGLWSLNADGVPQVYAVRDWIRLSYGKHVWPNFNIADSLLVCSAAWLAWQSFRPSHEMARHRPEVANS